METDRGVGLAPVLQALADPNRLGVVQMLSEGPRRAGEPPEASGLSAPAMSKHLRVLLEAGIVSDERVPEDARVPGLPASTGVGGGTAGLARSAPSALGRPVAFVQATRRGEAMTSAQTVSSEVEVAVDPATAFLAFHRGDGPLVGPWADQLLE